MRLLAQINAETLPTLFPPARFATIGSLTDLLFPLIMVGAAVLFLAMLFAGALRIISAGGTPEYFENGKRMMEFSFMGLIIILLAYFIVRLLGYITQIPFFL